MQRVFTKDLSENFKIGVVKDYPKSVWSQIAKSAKMKLDKFSKPIDDLASELKGKQK